MGNTEATPQPGESVETGRGASTDWSNLREDYEQTGSIRILAERYGVGFKKIRNELARQGIPIKPRGHVKGQKKSEAWREASRKHWDDPAWREEQRQKWLVRLPTMNGPSANSPLEKLLHRALRKAGISFSTQRLILGRYVADILITQKPVVIEADGNVHLRQQDKDARRDADMRAAGYEVFRFTGKPICNDPDGCVRQVIEAAGLTPDEEPVFDIRNGMSGPDSPTWKGGKPEWTCANCGKKFRAWMRNGKPRTTCSRDCQVEWQKKTKASVADRRSNGEKMRELWADPEWRARQVRLQKEGKQRAG
jgi:very-short-patch-repair endonuclease